MTNDNHLSHSQNVIQDISVVFLISKALCFFFYCDYRFLLEKKIMSAKKVKYNDDISAVSKLYAGSETGIILLAITCFEFQAEMKAPVDFTDENKEMLTRAVKYQLHDFRGKTRPFQFKNIIDR